MAQDQAAQERLTQLVIGRPSLPVIIVEDEIILGFDRTKLEQALGI